MSKEIITFGDIEVEKHKFHHCKNLALLEDVDINKYRFLIWFLQAKRIDILLVTKMMIMKLNHYA